MQYSPAYFTGNLDLPKDRHTINAWCRSFYALDPDVHRIINEHALFLTKHYELVDSEHEFANEFCRDMLDELNITALLEAVFAEYFVIGEVFCYAELNEAKGKWGRLIIQNPDYIVVKRSVENTEPIIMLRPDENLRRIVLSDKEEDIEQCKKLNSQIVSAIKNGDNIPLDNFNVSHIAHRMSPYEIRGSSSMISLFNILKSPDRKPEDTQAIKEALFDLRLPNSPVLKDVIEQRYGQMLVGFEQWLNKKILAPIAKINGFRRQCEPKVAGKDEQQKWELCFPQVKFDRVKMRKNLAKIK
jgi:hemoglobin-like flavoprotein